MPTSAERRAAPRYPCRFRAELYILFPEETFRPHPYLVTVRNASLSGIRVECNRLTLEQSKQLTTTARFARVVVRDEAGRYAKVYCRVVWVVTQPQGPDGRPIFELGMAFERRDPNDEEDIAWIVDRAKRFPDQGVPLTPPEED